MIEFAATPPSVVDNQESTFLARLESHAGIIRKVAASYSSTVADRHDLMQEITLQLWKAYPRYTPDRPFSTWMYRVALNVAISSLRRKSHPSRQTVSLDEMDEEVVDESALAARTDSRVALLQQVIATLPPLERALLLLYLDEQSYEEIAAVLGLTKTNVATKLSRLKERVRNEMLRLKAQDL